MRIIVSLLLFYIVAVLGQKKPQGPLTEDFQNWLISNGYEADAFDRSDIGPSGSFGGRVKPNERVII